MADGASRIRRNILANIVRGASAGLLAVILPAVLVRELPREAYSAWALVLQIAAYIAMLDLGLQVGIGRFVAREPARRDEFFNVGLALLGVCAAVGMVAAGLLAFLLPHLFPSVPAPLVAPARVAILAVGASSALSLLGSAVAAVFIGMERFEVPAAVLCVGRVIQIGAAWWAAAETHQVATVALAYAAGSVATQAMYVLAALKLNPRPAIRWRQLSREALATLAKYCGNLSVWNFSMLLVAGLDTAVVAEVDFRSLAAYSVCANLITVFVGLVGTALSVYVSRASALEGQGRYREIGNLLLAVSSTCTILLLAVALCGAALGASFLRLWVGPSLAVQALPILWVLIGANGLRLVVAPYAALLMGTGEQRWATRTALAEGTCNLAASIFLGLSLGAIGVAYGTLVGSFVGLVLVLVFTFPRAKRIQCGRGEFMTTAIVYPLLAFLPMAVGVGSYLANGGIASSLLMAVGIAVTALVLIRDQLGLFGFISRRLGETTP
jgi:O-antigen/teichoic acid export membrane protein